MSKFLVQTTGRWHKDDWERAGEDFRVRFSDRGAYEDVGGTQERYPHQWCAVQVEVEAATALEAVQKELTSFEADAAAAELPMPDAFHVDVEPTPPGRVPSGRQYRRRPS